MATDADAEVYSEIKFICSKIEVLFTKIIMLDDSKLLSSCVLAYTHRTIPNTPEFVKSWVDNNNISLYLGNDIYSKLFSSFRNEMYTHIINYKPESIKKLNELSNYLEDWIALSTKMVMAVKEVKLEYLNSK